MLGRLRILVLATCLAGCGALLSSFGSDAEDEPAPGGDGADAMQAALDGAVDSTVDLGGEDAAKADAALDSGTKDADADVTIGPVPRRYVFVTSTVMAGNFGYANADEICKTHANDGGLPILKGRQWRAWLGSSSPVTNASDHIGSTPLRGYQLVDGTLVANDLADLVDGTIEHPIDRDETSSEVTLELVWTGAQANGGQVSTNCTNWTTPAQGINGKVGTTGSKGPQWSEVNDMPCSTAHRLYCFEF